MTSTGTLFEFDTLDKLWAYIKDMKPGEQRVVRHARQMAQGVFNDLKDDPRFNIFKWHNSGYRLPYQVDDLHVFTISRKSK